MKTTKFNLFGLFFAMMVSTVIFSCGGDTAADAADKARETITTTADNAATAAKTAADKATTPAEPTGPTTTVEFEEMEFDFGTIDEGEKASHKYKFKNTGSEPLIISNAKGSCGCTVPQWPKDPIAPGESSEILVEFNSKNKKGKQSKRVTITANTDPTQTFLTIKGEVTPDPNKPAPAAKTPTAVPATPK